MTTSTSKTIQIHLPTGDPSGIRIAEQTTHIVQALLIPRKDLASVKDRKELKQPGIYFLFGEADEESKPSVYIGQTENASKRFGQHDDREFWQTAILCVSRADSFTQTHIRYLEWHCIHEASSVGRYRLTNAQKPVNPIHVPESLKGECLDSFENMRMLLSTLGHPVFASFAKQDDSAIALYCRGGGSEAKGSLTACGFVVYAGSKVRKTVVDSSLATILPKRNELITDGVLINDDDQDRYVFAKNHEFKSPSAAADIVLGRSANGKIEWKDENGTELKSLDFS